MDGASSGQTKLATRAELDMVIFHSRRQMQFCMKLSASRKENIIDETASVSRGWLWALAGLHKRHMGIIIPKSLTACGIVMSLTIMMVARVVGLTDNFPF